VLLRLIRDQRIAFVIVGGINTLIGLGWFLLFHRLVGNVVGYMGALVLAHICAVLCAFTLHRRFVFRVRGQVLTDLARFELVNLGALGANAVLLPFFVEIVGLKVVMAQIISTFISVITTYVGHRVFSFRRRHPQAGEAR
jgi:putative flippase GtrA